MHAFLNNSGSAVVVLHEIYGINRHITGVCEELSKLGFDVFSPDLLGVPGPFDYDHEDFAYRYFTGRVGFEKAAGQVTDFLRSIRNQYKYICVLGYSVGATVAWLCSGEKGLADAAIGFYGSRIRDYLEIEPSCPVLLFFPAREKSFDVDGLVDILSKKANVMVKKMTGDHGFADRYSKNHCRESSGRSFEEMVIFINNILRKDI